MAELQKQLYEKIQQAVGSERAQKVVITVDERQIVYLKGIVERWQDVVDVGHAVGKFPGIKGVVNQLESKDYTPETTDRTQEIEAARKKGVVQQCDILIIGGGITGCGIARTLSKYNRKILLIEKNADVCEGASKANNGMVHSGYDSAPGTLKAELCVKGNAMYTEWQRELNFNFKRCGSFVVAFDEEDEDYLRMYYDRGRQNHVPGIALLKGDVARQIEPHISPDVTMALWTPSAGYIETYEVTEALMENAVDNGAQLMLSTEALAMDVEGDKVTAVVTNQGVINANCVINAAGIYADEIAKMAGDQFYTLHGRRGSLILFDKKKQRDAPRCFIGTAPRNFTKGGGPMQTPEGNPFWGPSAIEVPDKEDVGVDAQDLDFVLEKGKHLSPGVSERDMIRFFSGNRPASYTEDFIIEGSDLLHNFIHVAGIQSPGVAAAPAIDEKVEGIYLERFPKTTLNPDYNPIRKGVKPFRKCTHEEQEALIKKDARYGHIICRCETITEAEIVRAIHGKIPALTVDAVKRRTRAGMGRCQGGFCGPRVVEIIARESGIAQETVTKNGPGTEILVERSRQEAGQ